MDTRRDIVVPWHCARSGDCCEQVGEVRMTWSERAAIERADPTSATTLSWVPDPDARFTRLHAHPCPLLTRDAEGRAACSIHAVRPLVCRTFQCGRVDVKREPFESEPVHHALGLTGCGNLTARLQESLRFRESYRTNAVQELRRWGLTHGYQAGGSASARKGEAV